MTPDKLLTLADAQPVAWMYEHDGCVDTPLFTVNRWTKCEEPWNESPLFLHPAPAAPQAEPKREPLSDERIAEIQRAAYERAAQECEAQISGSDHHYLATHGHWDHMAQAATNCAAAIRALGANDGN